MQHGLGQVVDHFLLSCIVMAFIITTMLGVGNASIAGMLGLLLCAAGVLSGPARVDPWVLGTLLVYQLISMASSWAALGTVSGGYAPVQGIFPVLYLLTGCLDENEERTLKLSCVMWGGAAAAAGIGQFVWRAAVQGSARRASGFLGNPNALGIFLVLNWFALLELLEDRETQERRPWLWFLEPLLLTALALTLSLGSFAAMAAGTVCAVRPRRGGWREAAEEASRLLARASFGVGTGVLLYLSAARTGYPWLCLVMLAYALAAVCCWRTLVRFLKASPGMAVLMAGCGVLVAAAVIAVRPSSWATFSERLEMIRSGLGYLAENPFLGVGPYQWRLLDLYDGGKYFNTWHIHNTLIHVGVELGWGAMAALVLLVLRFYRRRRDPMARAGFTAFCVHNLVDTSFFYLGISARVMLAASDVQSRKKTLGTGAVRVLCGGFAVMFAYNLYCFITGAYSPHI